MDGLKVETVATLALETYRTLSKAYHAQLDEFEGQGHRTVLSVVAAFVAVSIMQQRLKRVLRRAVMPESWETIDGVIQVMQASLDAEKQGIKAQA